MGLSENISDHILCCICNEQTGVYQCRDSVGIYAEYDYERRPGAGKPSGIYNNYNSVDAIVTALNNNDIKYAIIPNNINVDKILSKIIVSE